MNITVEEFKQSLKDPSYIARQKAVQCYDSFIALGVHSSRIIMSGHNETHESSSTLAEVIFIQVHLGTIEESMVSDMREIFETIYDGYHTSWTHSKSWLTFAVPLPARSGRSVAVGMNND